MPGAVVTYLGGPTVLLEYADLRILTDPTFDPPGEYANPGSSTLVKTAGPGLPAAAIEPVDVILLSHHEHKDNLDVAGAALIATGIPTFATPYAAAGLGGSVRGLAIWESTRLGESRSPRCPHSTARRVASRSWDRSPDSCSRRPASRRST